MAGYCRAVRIGNVIEVSGTTAVKDGKVLHVSDAYSQTKAIIGIAQKALCEAGAELTDVIRTRMYVTDISNWEKVTQAHGEFFRDIKPTTTLVEVSALIDPDMLVEIEFSAYLGAQK